MSYDRGRTVQGLAVVRFMALVRSWDDNLSPRDFLLEDRSTIARWRSNRQSPNKDGMVRRPSSVKDVGWRKGEGGF